jgi:K+-sensing histidine kinase KdpD
LQAKIYEAMIDLNLPCSQSILNEVTDKLINSEDKWKNTASVGTDTSFDHESCKISKCNINKDIILNLLVDFKRLMSVLVRDNSKIKQFRAEALPVLENVIFSQSMTENLINDLMDLGKLQQGVFKFDQVYFSLPKVVQNAFQMVRATADSKEIKLEANIKHLGNLEYLDNLCGDPRRYLQILLNFLSNAIKFTPNKGTITVRLEAIDFVNLGEPELRANVLDNCHRSDLQIQRGREMENEYSYRLNENGIRESIE